ncbi:MAG TPA: TonB-dependent receptor [Lacunisphaera sp.]|nr:TonB-dependent receptor [Lacunisphaera sp.]
MPLLLFTRAEMPGRLFRASLRLAALLVWGATLHAGEKRGPIINLDPLVVEGTSPTESPATVSRFDLTGRSQAGNTMTQFALQAANFFASTNDAHSFNDTFALRGLTNTPIFGGPAVSCYLDDLPLGNPFTFPADLQGFASAELHRGPSQNTLFGRAGSAGVITLNTPEPGQVAVGDLHASYGSYNVVNFSASASSATAPRGDIYVSTSWSRRDGYIENTRLGLRIDDKDSRTALARLRFRPTAASEITLLVTGLRARDGVQPLVPLGGPLFVVTRHKEGLTNLDACNASLKASFTIPTGFFSATTSLSHWDLDPYANTLSFGPLELANNVTQRQHLWSEEFKFVSDPKAAVNWRAGTFWSAGKMAGAFSRFFGSFPFESSVFRLQSHDLAVFGEMTFQAAPSLRVTAGVRLEDSRRKMDRIEYVPSSQVFALENEATAMLPKLEASYVLDRSTRLFATLGTGCKPGGFSAFTGNRALSAFGPERTRTMEAGVTRATADQRLAATVRLFWYDITGYQIERSFATGAATDDYLVVNAPRARSRGAEIELTWKPLTGLTLATDLGTTDVTLREFTDPYTQKNYAGNRAPYVPTYDTSLRADYQHPGGWFGGVEVNSNGRTYYTEGENLTFGQRAVSLVSARLGYHGGRYRVTAYGQNLTNRGYYSAITPGTGHGTPGAPRTFGIETSLTF